MTLSAAAAAPLAGTAQAALQDRDLDGNGATDAFYDTDLNMTWLRDANVNGQMHLQAALDWAGNFSFGAYGDWRLPTNSVRDCYISASCRSEMGHPWYDELGNPAGALTNTGNFQNLLPAIYWTGPGLYNGASPYSADDFDQATGLHGWSGQASLLCAMAVRDGDVPAIPEPGTYALMLIGLGVLASARRHTPR